MPSTPMIVPSAKDTTVSTRCTPKNAVIPSFHERLSVQMFFRKVDDHLGHMSTRGRQTSHHSHVSPSAADQAARTIVSASAAVTSNLVCPAN